MNVIYDISLLGKGCQPHDPRGGIFRFVEEVAHELSTSRELLVGFSSTQNIFETMEYWKQNGFYNRVPLYSTPVKKYFDLQKHFFKNLIGWNRLNGSERSNYTANGLSRNSVRDTLRKLYQFAEASLSPIGEEELKSADIFHSTFYPIPPQVRTRKKVVRFLTIYDLIPVLYPAFCPMMNDDIGRILDDVKKDDFIFCISQTTKNDLCDYLGIGEERVFVTYPAASEDLFYQCVDAERTRLVLKKYGVPNAPYVLSLGRLEPRKNINHAVRCFSRLVQQQKIKDLNFVLVGAPGWQSESIYKEVAQYEFLKNRIIFTGYVDDADLAPLYSGALCFLFMSLYEGFGLPLLEAMQCGTPVIASNTASVPEVTGEAGILVPPCNTDELCQSLLEVYQKPSLRERLSRLSLGRSKRFSWKQTALDVQNAYKQAHNLRGQLS